MNKESLNPSSSSSSSSTDGSSQKERTNDQQENVDQTPQAVAAATASGQSPNTQGEDQLQQRAQQSNINPTASNSSWYTNNLNKLKQDYGNFIGRFCIVFDQQIEFFDDSCRYINQALDIAKDKYILCKNPFITKFENEYDETEEIILERKFDMPEILRANFIWYFINYKNLLQTHSRQIGKWCVVFNNELHEIQNATDLNDAFNKVRANKFAPYKSLILIHGGLNVPINSNLNPIQHFDANTHKSEFKFIQPNGKSYLFHNYAVDDGAELVTVLNYDQLNLDDDFLFGLSTCETSTGKYISLVVKGFKCGVNNDDAVVDDRLVALPFDMRLLWSICEDGNKFRPRMEINNDPEQSTDNSIGELWKNEFFNLYENADFIDWILSSNYYVQPKLELFKCLKNLGILSKRFDFIDGVFKGQK